MFWKNGSVVLNLNKIDELKQQQFRHSAKIRPTNLFTTKNVAPQIKKKSFTLVR